MSVITQDSTLLCVVCGQIHPTLPPETTRIIGTVSVTGYHCSDYTYVYDLYKGVAGPMCKTHDREEISERKDSAIDAEYDYNDA